MEESFKYIFYVILILVILNSILTLILGSIRWLIEKYEWKARVALLVVFILLGMFVYVRFEDFFMLILEKIQ